MFDLFEEIHCGELHRELGFSATRTHYWILPGPDQESIFLAYYVPFMSQISSANQGRMLYLPSSNPKLYK